MKKINLKFLRCEWQKELKILKDYPLKIAISFATGIFIGFTPTIGFQTILCYLISRLIGGSFIIMFIGGSIPTGIPYLIPFTYYGCYKVGLLITKTHPVFKLSDFKEFKSFLSWVIIDIGKPLIYGCLVCGTIGWIVSFFIIYSILKFKNKKFFSTFLGVLWEWVIIPFLFYLIFRNKKILEYVFPMNKFLLFSVFIIYLISGLILTVSSSYCLHKKGNGTIMPQFPTKKLVKDGVYFYCRNPMYLGYSFLYFAFSFLLKNVWFSFISIGIFIFMFVLAKIFEEKKLYERFGKEYIEYKKETPFILPLKILCYSEKNLFFYCFYFCFILSIFIFLFNFYILICLLLK
ncbi:MAG: DUF2062 domain-containing protein [Minisyncoccia bacterium]